MFKDGSWTPSSGARGGVHGGCERVEAILEKQWIFKGRRTRKIGRIMRYKMSVEELDCN